MISKHTPDVKSHGYMYKLLETSDLKSQIETAIEELRNIEFDAVAFRGISGAMLGPIIALALNKSMILVRKPNDGSHALADAGNSWSPLPADCLVEGDINAESYIIVDDFISTGSTVETIRREIGRAIPKAAYLGTMEVTRIRPGNGLSRPSVEYLQRIGKHHTSPCAYIPMYIPVTNLDERK